MWLLFFEKGVSRVSLGVAAKFGLVVCFWRVSRVSCGTLLRFPRGFHMVAGQSRPNSTGSFLGMRSEKATLR